VVKDLALNPLIYGLDLHKQPPSPAS
jgi:hypothetical protein